MDKKYIEVTYYEVALKQRLASLIGREWDNLSSLSVKDLLHEVEVQKKEYVHMTNGKRLEPAVEDAYLYVNTGYPFN